MSARWYLWMAGFLVACSKGESGGPSGATSAAPSFSPEAASAAWPAVSIPPLSEDRTLEASRRRGEYKAKADLKIRQIDARIELVEQLVKAGKIPPAKLATIRELRQKIDLAFHHVEGATDAEWPFVTAEFGSLDKSLTEELNADLATKP